MSRSQGRVNQGEDVILWDYTALHRLTSAQSLAASAIGTGTSHQKAAEVAGVHRVTVTNWSNHHPEFIAEVNRIRSDIADEVRADCDRLTRSAIDLVAKRIADGDVQSAFKWLKISPPETLLARGGGPLHSVEVVDRIRRQLPGPVESILVANDEVGPGEAEAHLVQRLAKYACYPDS